MAFIEFTKPIVREIPFSNHSFTFSGYYQEINPIYIREFKILLISKYTSLMRHMYLKELCTQYKYYYFYHPILKFVVVERDVEEVEKPKVVDGKFNL